MKHFFDHDNISWYVFWLVIVGILEIIGIIVLNFLSKS